MLDPIKLILVSFVLSDRWQILLQFITATYCANAWNRVSFSTTQELHENTKQIMFLLSM